MSEHETIIVKHPNQTEISIDVKLAKILSLCWNLGIETTCCCEQATGSQEDFQEHSWLKNEWAYIGFKSVIDAQEFMLSIKNDMTREEWCHCQVKYWLTAFNPTCFDISPNDVWVSFPQEDLHWIEERLIESLTIDCDHKWIWTNETYDIDTGEEVSVFTCSECKEQQARR